VLNRASGPAGEFESLLVPITGAWVSHRDRPEEIGFVVAQTEAGIEVDFGPGGRAKLAPGEWACGFHPGFTVQDVPLSAARDTLGVGTVVETRSICDRHQVLVQFHADGLTRWLPFERLRRIMDPVQRFVRRAQHAQEPAERTALNTMAHALRLWNQATGALDRLDVDPLPHQISLVHRIINSGTVNWLIADDVGLGKTIEVGLLLAALERSRNIRRILVVAPAGLTRQWQDEMDAKFDRRFLIYGRDFNIAEPKDWLLYERVIVSLDLAKPQTAEDHGTDVSTRFGMLLAAGVWDIVIFDEAHRLSRGERGDMTLRYRLAKELRGKTDALVLLTGTPHQGDAAKFQNLLVLVRPELERQIQMLEFNPEIVREMILRNRKIDAVDADGTFIFRGTVVRRLEVPLTKETEQLERLLQDYLRRGYSAGQGIGGARGRAVGFVMTIYRKLASSSVFALGMALKKRLARLKAQQQAANADAPLTESAAELGEAGEGDDLLGEAQVANTASPFFADEIERLENLLRHVVTCFSSDPKRTQLVDTVRELVQGKGKKLLIFTEYRNTQHYLDLTLTKLGVKTCLIHGSMDLDEKRAAITSFENDADVMISTEAGGEGLNLHRRCHVMVNYDLPWNPSRLTQRIGRLYRYGQTEQVIVINLHARDTIDNEILSTVMQRLDTVVRQMSAVNSEFDERYQSEVMGELLERLDIEALLDEAGRGKVERSTERIDAAIAQAQKAKAIQDEILAGADRYDRDGWKDLGALSTLHLAQFIKRMAPFEDIMVEPHRSDPESFTLRLPAELKGSFGEFGARTVIAATTRRGKRNGEPDAVPMDFASSFVRYLISKANAPEFEGGYGALLPPAVASHTAAVFLARYQNDQGQATGENIVVSVRNPEGRIDVDNAAILPLFDEVQATAMPGIGEPKQRADLAEALRDRAELDMAGRCTKFLHPNSLVALAFLEGSLSEEAD
jgi:ERCC4-related helicase